MRFIICPVCLTHSRSPGDIADGFCGGCRLQTRGRVIDLQPEGQGEFVIPMLRAVSLYAVELHAVRALRTGAPVRAVMDAVSAAALTAIGASRSTPSPAEQPEGQERPRDDS